MMVAGERAVVSNVVIMDTGYQHGMQHFNFSVTEIASVCHHMGLFLVAILSMGFSLAFGYQSC